jgi:hypothetical protein
MLNGRSHEINHFLKKGPHQLAQFLVAIEAKVFF